MGGPAILVTGGAGFVGSQIVRRLAARGDVDVVVCDRLREAASGKWRNIAKHPIADLTPPEALPAWLAANQARVVAVVHMGAVSSTTEADADKIIENNFRLSKAIWDWCAAHAKPLVYASSAATYGAAERGFADDNAVDAVAALRPLNAYGWSKKLFDLYAVRETARGHAPPKWSGLRFFNVYGPNEYHKGPQMSVVAHMYPGAAQGAVTRLFKSHHPDYADGGQKRDFVYVDDCAAVAEWLLANERGGGVLNVGSGEARTFLELAHALHRALNAEARIEYVDTPAEIRRNYQYFTQADLTRLRALGYDRPMTSLETGVGTYVSGYLSTDDPYA
ncbi:MAG: ADP-glyceromanno-heptose 6-epimerase [Hyphomonadaceae bacterium]|nr:ADP-glyceromanno-heptose 6-epimerase [Hyphomonadaceae bacterium]